MVPLHNTQLKLGQAINLGPDFVANNKRPDTGWSPCKDQVPRL